MEKYKQGQVASVLFSGKKVSKQSNDSALAKLFSTPEVRSKSPGKKSPATAHQQLKQKNVLPKVSKKENHPPKKRLSKPESKKLREKEMVSSSPVTKKSNSGKKRKLQNESKPKSSQQDQQPDKSDLEVLITSDTTTKDKHKDKSPPAKKRKLNVEKNDDDDDDEKVKRPRRNRQRDKTADKRTVFVGNCPLSADKKSLKKLFQKYGKIETIRFRCAPPGDPNLPKRVIAITKNFHEQCNNYVAYIVYEEEKAAKQALVRNGHVVDGHHLRVDIAASAKKHDKKRSAFIGNLPFDVSEEDIRAHFSDCGDITNVRIVRDRQTSLGKGICYVQFESKDSVSLALKLKNSELRGRPLRVEVCTNKPKKKDKAETTGKRNTPKPQDKKKKPSFAPSNSSTASFKNLLKTKKEKRLRKIKKKKQAGKKTDGLSAIFGDVPADTKNTGKKKGKVQVPGKGKKSFGKKPQGKGQGMKKNFGKKANSFKSKGKGGKR